MVNRTAVGVFRFLTLDGFPWDDLVKPGDGRQQLTMKIVGSQGLITMGNNGWYWL